MEITFIEESKAYVYSLLSPFEKLIYHNYGHAINVMERALYIAEKEGCGDQEKELLCIAALFHDTGFSICYDENEIYGAKIAHHHLRDVSYPDENIFQIEQIIRATSPNIPAQNILEQIIKDADMDNLGREDFFEINTLLKSEQESIKNISIPDEEWRVGTIQMMDHHSYFTKTQQKERQEQFLKNKAKFKNK